MDEDRNLEQKLSEGEQITGRRVNLRLSSGLYDSCGRISSDHISVQSVVAYLQHDMQV